MMRIGIVFAVIVAVCWLFWPSAQALHEQWSSTSSAYTYGYLIAGLCVWLLLRERARIAALPWLPSPIAALALLPLALLWLVVYRSGLQFAFECLFPMLVWCAVYALFGWPIARRCLFPVGYLYFAISVWGLINPLAQWGTILAVRLMLRVFAIPAYFDGNLVQLPAGVFEIADGCSGLNFLVSALALAVLLGQLRRDTLGVRVKLLLLAAAFAVVTNWVRVFTIIVAGYLTDMQHYLVRVNHYYFGWILFGLAIWVFFILARRIGVEPPLENSGRHAAGAPPPNLVKLGFSSAITLAFLSIPTVWGGVGASPDASSYPARMLPSAPAGWSGPRSLTGSWQPVFANADRLAQGLYARGGRHVEITEAAYFNQRQGKELGGYSNSVAGEGFELLQSRTVSAAGRSFGEWQVRDAGDRPSLLWYGYAVGDRWFIQATRAQVWYGLSSLARSQLSRAVVLKAGCTPDCDGARQLLEDFVGTGILE